MAPHRAISPPSPLGRRAAHVLAAVTLLACGPPGGDDVGDDVGSEVTGVEPGDNPLCVAPEEPTLARFALTDQATAAALGDGEHDLDCVLDSVAVAEDGSRSLGLIDCESLVGGPGFSALTLDLTIVPEIVPVLDPGAVVRLRYAGTDEARRFTLHLQPGGLLLLAGIDASSLEADTDLIDLEPLHLSLTEADCTVDEPCGQASRMFIIVEMANDEIIVADGGHAIIGEMIRYLVAVEQARLFPATCETAPGRFEVLLSLAPEG